MAGHTAQSGLGTFLKLGRLVGTIYGMSALMIAVMVALIAIRTRIPPLTVLGRLRAPLFTAFGSGSSVATLPSALQVCEGGLGLRQQTAQMVLPLGVTLYPVGNVLHVVVASLFVLQLYDLPLSLQAGLVVAVGGILVACAMSSAPGVASMTLLAMLLSPFGVPVEVAVVLLVALDPILDPILTTVNVLGNITAASMMEPKRSATSL
jgi:Na+/H+-dicarboxylate symporter